MTKIAKIVDEVRTSYATYNRKLRELRAVQSKCESPAEFFSVSSKTLIPLFGVQRLTVSTQRALRFVSALAVNSDDRFLEDFFKFLLVGAVAADKTARFRACRIISEVCNFSSTFFFFWVK